MNRRGFLGAILGAPWLGWVTKLDERGEPTLKAIEPVQIPEQSSTAMDYDITYSDGASTTTWYILPDGVPFTYTGGTAS